MLDTARQLEFTFAVIMSPAASRNNQDNADRCFACGDQLLCSNGEGCSWNSRYVTWEILGRRKSETRGDNFSDRLLG